MHMDEVLTASQVAALLKIHPRTVYNLARKGSIPGRKLGGSWRFRRDAILKMIYSTGLEKGEPRREVEH
jgi:excisionase family DNA binding protein